jgi:hypothetical protein
MLNNSKLEKRMQAMEKSMGTVVKALKEMRANINEVKENRIKQNDNDIVEILESNKMIEETLLSHTNIISIIEKEIKRMGRERGKAGKFWRSTHRCKQN